MTETLQRVDTAETTSIDSGLAKVEAQIREKISHHSGNASEEEIIAALEQGWQYGVIRDKLSEREMKDIAHAICTEDARKKLALEDPTGNFASWYPERLRGDFTPVYDAVSQSALAGLRHARANRAIVSPSDADTSAV